MSDPFLEKLKSVIRVEQHFAPEQGTVVHLQETDVGATLKSVRMGCLGCGDVVAFTLDVKNGGEHVPLSNHTRKGISAKWNKVCDGVFVWRSGDGTLRILLCDLKSSTPTGSRWKYQLWSSSCFVKYLLEIVRRFNEELPPEPPPVFHAVALHNGPFGRNKRGTGLGPGVGYPASTIDEPERMAISNGQRLILRAFAN
jgi:hypothetical protein